MPGTILLAEDEHAIAETVLYALRADGFAAEHVLLGGEVLPRLRRGGIDLVVLDVGLPDRSGFDVCRELRAESAVPVLFLCRKGWHKGTPEKCRAKRYKEHRKQSRPSYPFW